MIISSVIGWTRSSSPSLPLDRYVHNSLVTYVAEKQSLRSHQRMQVKMNTEYAGSVFLILQPTLVPCTRVFGRASLVLAWCRFGLACDNLPSRPFEGCQRHGHWLGRCSLCHIVGISRVECWCHGAVFRHCLTFGAHLYSGVVFAVRFCIPTRSISFRAVPTKVRCPTTLDLDIVTLSTTCISM
jgi:hypothetical protein